MQLGICFEMEEVACVLKKKTLKISTQICIIFLDHAIVWCARYSLHFIRVFINEFPLKPGFDTRSGNILSFLLSLFQEGQLSITGESVCTKYWLTA